MLCDEGHSPVAGVQRPILQSTSIHRTRRSQRPKCRTLKGARFFYIERPCVLSCSSVVSCNFANVGVGYTLLLAILRAIDRFCSGPCLFLRMGSLEAFPNSMQYPHSHTQHTHTHTDTHTPADTDRHTDRPIVESSKARGFSKPVWGCMVAEGIPSCTPYLEAVQSVERLHTHGPVFSLGFVLPNRLAHRSLFLLCSGRGQVVRLQ